MSNQQTFDYIIADTGLAGGSLATAKKKLIFQLRLTRKVYISDISMSRIQ
ncbi:MAG: hypothetical protein WBO58_14350 [Gammaproteobacteria bacterium]